MLSPFNVWNWLVTAAALAPGIGMLMLSDKLKHKRDK